VTLHIVRREHPGPARLLQLVDSLQAPHEATTLILPPSDGERLRREPANGVDQEAIELLADRKMGLPFGLFLFSSPAGAIAVRPPFPPSEYLRINSWDFASLLEIMGRPRVLGLVLIRRGGFCVGVFDGDLLVASKTGTRFVKNRHRKGGQSQSRYDRMREKHLGELYGKTCETARAVLSPRLPQIDAVFLGGDRRAALEFRGGCEWIERLGERLQPRFVPTPEPRQAILQIAFDEVWRSDLIVLQADGSEVPDEAAPLVPER
jgi:Actinobacteria/chloroflexi VLRF1 release factor